MVYPPSAILTSGGLDPAEVGAACGLVDLDCTPVRPAPRWLRMLWRGPVAGMTVPWAIYVRRDVLAGDRTTLARLLAHELVHVRQWSELGALRFAGSYLAAYIRGRVAGRSHHQAYLDIPQEREARDLSRH